MAGGGTRLPSFQGIDPKGRVPTLVCDDGSVSSEFSAIATWIARLVPEAGLMTKDAAEEARAVELMAYVEGTIHAQGFALQDPVHGTLGVDADDVRRQGREIVDRWFALLDPVLAAHNCAAGDRFMIADAAIFYVERWTAKQKIACQPTSSGTTRGCSRGQPFKGSGKFGARPEPLQQTFFCLARRRAVILPDKPRVRPAFPWEMLPSESRERQRRARSAADGSDRASKARSQIPQRRPSARAFHLPDRDLRATPVGGRHPRRCGPHREP